MGYSSNAEYDWAEAWSKRLGQHGLRANLERQGIASEKFWDNFNNWKEWQNNSKYPGQLLERIQQSLQADDRFLDIGAGAGAFAIPVSKTCKLVTAVEPSPGQLARLQENAQKEGVNNLTIINKRWEDIVLSEIGQHEIVLAAYSFEMKNIKDALTKMLQAAKRYCFLIHTAGHDLMEPIYELLDVLPGPDYLYLYNVLYQMGVRANIEIFSRHYRVPVELQMQMFAVNPGLNKEQQQILYTYLENHQRLETFNGQVWVNRQHKDALIWLKKEE